MASEVYERRLVARKRPYVEGAPLDDTGADPDVVELQIMFANGHGNPGVPDPAYPAYHRRFMREARVEGTGTLYYPGLGEIRCRLKRLDSRKISEERDHEMVGATFWSDTEDGRATAQNYDLPSAKTAGPVIVRKFHEESTWWGLGGDLFESIADLVSSLEAAANSPFDAAQELEARASLLIETTQRATALLLLPLSPFSGPDSAGPLALLNRLQDTAAAQRGAIFGTGSSRVRRFTETLSIFDVAARLGQSADDLIRLNPGLPLFGIPPGLPVWTKAA